MYGKGRRTNFAPVAKPVYHIIICICMGALLLHPIDMGAQEKPRSREKQQKELKKKKEKQIRKQRKAEEDLKKRHERIQTKATRKRMKETRKKSDKLNRGKRRR